MPLLSSSALEGRKPDYRKKEMKKNSEGRRRTLTLVPF
jgi:hypothetical protein